jgi:hypothetical protein
VHIYARRDQRSRVAPGLLRLINALKPKPLFQMLVMSKGIATRARADDVAYG